MPTQGRLRWRNVELRSENLEVRTSGMPFCFRRAPLARPGGLLQSQSAAHHQSSPRGGHRRGRRRCLSRAAPRRPCGGHLAPPQGTLSLQAAAAFGRSSKADTLRRVTDVSDALCASGGAAQPHRFCERCGEKRITTHDNSIVHFGEILVETLTHFDIRSLRALRLLVVRPRARWRWSCCFGRSCAPNGSCFSLSL
jgi:hypothetical protein